MPTGPYPSFLAEAQDYRRAALPRFFKSQKKLRSLLGPGQVARYTPGSGYWAGPPLKPVKPKGVVVRSGTTPQSSFTTIESPAQIEARVTRMAQAAFDREQGAVQAEAARLRMEAEARRRGMQAAYQAAAQANAGFGADVQKGWEQAAGTVQGLANTGTGVIAQGLQNELASQEAALSRVGAGGTGFDARSQAGVEAYRGGTLPAEYFTRLGGVGRQFANDAATALNIRGLQEGIAGERETNQKIDTDLLQQVQELTKGRTDYETKLRDQLTAAQTAQLKLAQDTQQYNASLALKRVQIEQAQQRIDQAYREAKAKAVTTAQKFALDKWYKEQNLILSQARLGVAQQNANISQQRADQAAPGAKAKVISPSVKSNTIARATKAGGAAIQSAFANIWAKTPGASVPAGWDESKSGKYVNSPQYAAAVQWSARQRQKSFGTIMSRVINAIGPHLRSIGYTPAQIKRAAYQIVSARVETPQWWLEKNPSYVSVPIVTKA